MTWMTWRRGRRSACLILGATVTVKLFSQAFVSSARPSASPRGHQHGRRQAAVALRSGDGAAVSEPVFTVPLRRLELNSSAFVGAGYDLVDIQVLLPDQDPVKATFMLDSGLTTNLIAPDLYSQLNLPDVDGAVVGNALGGEARSMRSTLLPGLELLGQELKGQSRYSGIWEGGGWRARCSLDWEGWLKEAKDNDGKLSNKKVEYAVLPTSSMTDAQIDGYVGIKGTELVEGVIVDGPAGPCFLGRGVSVEPKGFLAVTEKYELCQVGGEIVDTTGHMRLRKADPQPTLPLPPPLHATCLPFAQQELAAGAGLKLDGMLGQVPLHQALALEINPDAGCLKLHAATAAQEAARSAGLHRLPGLSLESRLIGIQLQHAPLMTGLSEIRQEPVPALVDTGSANTILNWPAAEQLLGISPGDRVVQDAPIIRAIGVGGGNVDMPLITVAIGLVGEGGALVRPQPVRVAVGDANIFGEIFGKSESGSWLFGLGPKRLKPAALIGQDILSQKHYLLASSEPAVYMSPLQRATAPVTHGHLDFVGLGDCVDQDGKRLRGFQKLSCTPDEAAWECIKAPPGLCAGVAVTPKGKYQGLCYIFIDDSSQAKLLERSGFRRYAAPVGQELAPTGSVVTSFAGDQEAECYRWSL